MRPRRHQPALSCPQNARRGRRLGDRKLRDVVRSSSASARRRRGRGRRLHHRLPLTHAPDLSLATTRADRVQRREQQRRGSTRARCARGRGRTAPGWGVVSRRPAVVRRFHAVEATRVHQTGSWLVSFSILRRFWGRRRAWAAALFEPGARRGVPGERRRATGGRRLRSGRRRREPVALSADGGGDPIGKKRWKLAARLRRVSGAAAGVVRAEPHGARGTDERTPPAPDVN